ncbi:hypothetical protein MKK63_09460 [Methylobacterium sp. J-088]|uniref:hypothetical protein n=1 Tax=Methylobacterium sp. J-088 TaxID=2836664 RepID=UPI001FB99FF3|nr:hypothetical protein [Methylobacterium sp. J-088]MCJ2062936.1 hypothetical protein [Methylobacterium sp. J-088]
MPSFRFDGLNSVQCWRVEAELCGSGLKPWRWAIYSSDAWLATHRSEAMFRTSKAAKRVGGLIAAGLYLGSKAERADLH